MKAVSLTKVLQHAQAQRILPSLPGLLLIPAGAAAAAAVALRSEARSARWERGDDAALPVPPLLLVLLLALVQMISLPSARGRAAVLEVAEFILEVSNNSASKALSAQV